MKKILKEFKSPDTHSLDTVVGALQSKIGALQQVGGPSRKYMIEEEGKKGVIFMIGNSLSAIGLGFHTTNNVETVYFWKSFSFERSPEYAIDVPQGNFAAMVPAIVNMIHSQQVGRVDL